uniref:Uncharacterized protein n=1 Tax=Setaria digitata TaxID=48799 RepID=A0A915PX54_9BILA
MTLSVVIYVCLLSFLLIETVAGCDILVRVKSRTRTPFHAQVIAPSGKTSEKKLLNQNGRLLFQEKGSVCGVGPFQIKTFSKGNQNKFDKEEHNIKVRLNGVGAVTYEVGNDLLPEQVFRQGAECQGDCAPLAVPQHKKPGRKVAAEE